MITLVFINKKDGRKFYLSKKGLLVSDMKSIHYTTNLFSLIKYIHQHKKCFKIVVVNIEGEVLKIYE